MHVHAGRLFKFIGNAIKHFVTLFFYRRVDLGKIGLLIER